MQFPRPSASRAATGADGRDATNQLSGGQLDPEETSQDAAVCELEEETGATVPTAELRQVGAFARAVVCRPAPASVAACSTTSPACWLAA
ncbi:hypothetical protein A7J05_36545 [Streptomyces alfalfae]|uniref:Nudix hydrolase domain-containing protein n=1 Tax=Streptomyces alfalfae TaxID=1642299 RepID=A0ABN4VDM5_9ACTN|nr:hypothetical protein A7J05_00190 [Streptomyces alfalfae]APY90434.1 hypothetical protein A7J05_36545 [Streptomyces alfalfae]